MGSQSDNFGNTRRCSREFEAVNEIWPKFPRQVCPRGDEAGLNQERAQVQWTERMPCQEATVFCSLDDLRKAFLQIVFVAERATGHMPAICLHTGIGDDMLELWTQEVRIQWSTHTIRVRRVLVPISLSLYLSISLSLYLSISLSLYLSISLSLYLSISLSLYLSISLSLYLSASTSLSLYLSISLPVYLSTSLFLYLSIFLSLYLCIFLPLYLSISLSLCLSVSLSLYLSLSLCISLSLYVSISLFLYLSISLAL